MRVQDADLERDYIGGKALLAFIKDTGTGGGVEPGSEVELTYLKMEETFSGSLALDPRAGGGADDLLGRR